MKTIELKQIEHIRRIGDTCEFIEPNVNEDCIFTSEGEPIGFYLSKLPKKATALAMLANTEFRSKNVPKSELSRGTKKLAEKKGIIHVTQYSSIIGSVPPKAHMRRLYPTMSSIHSVSSAKTFIKAMLMLAKESENIIKEIIPDQYQKQKELLSRVDPKWRFANLFTSSISNFNIPAPFHQDRANIVGTVNVIITKRKNAKGGSLHIPDYNATVAQEDNSILVYPAWRNMHGVTPILPTHKDGYRNSLVFYALNAFVNK